MKSLHCEEIWLYKSRLHATNAGRVQSFSNTIRHPLICVHDSIGNSNILLKEYTGNICDFDTSKILVNYGCESPADETTDNI